MSSPTSKPRQGFGSTAAGRAISALFSFRWIRSRTARALEWERRFHDAVRASNEEKYSEAERGYLAAVREAEGLGQDDLRLRVSLDSLCRLYRIQGRFAEAETVALRVLTLKERALGPAHSNVAATLEDMAEIYRALGETERAEKHRQRALEILQNAIGPDFQELAESLEKSPVLGRPPDK